MKNIGNEKLFSVVFVLVVLATFFTVSHSFADTASSTSTSTPRLVRAKTPSKNFSAIGLVSAVTETSLSLDSADGSDSTTTSSFTFDISHVQKIETPEYIPLTLSSVKVGDKVIVQGIREEEGIDARRIISFATTTLDIATTTATSTLELASSTEEASSTTLIEKIGNLIDKIVDFITGSSTPATATSTEEAPAPIDIATSTIATSTEEVVPETSTTTEEVVPEVSTSSSEHVEASVPVIPEIAPDATVPSDPAPVPPDTYTESQP